MDLDRGLKKLRITSGGNVQVNGGAVHLDANGEFAIFEQDTALAMTNSSKISMDFASNVARIRSSHNGSGSNAVSRPLAFYIGSSEKLRIDSSGVQVTGNVDLAADGDTILLGTGDDFQISFDGTNGVLKGVTGVQNINVWTENTAKYQFTAGSFRPLSDNSYDLGDSSLRWRNLYTQDLQLSNKAKGGNDVDETWGDWTLQEGENDIFMINNRNGKKYKINLTEVL